MDTALADTPSVYATVAANDDAKDALCAVARSTPLTVCVTAIITVTATVGASVGAPGRTEGRNVGSWVGMCVMIVGRCVDGSGVGSSVGLTVGAAVGEKETEGAAVVVGVAVVGVTEGAKVVGKGVVGSTVGLHVCPGTVGAKVVGSGVGRTVGRAEGVAEGLAVVGVTVGMGEGTAVSVTLARYPEATTAADRDVEESRVLRFVPVVAANCDAKVVAPPARVAMVRVAELLVDTRKVARTALVVVVYVPVAVG